MKSKSYLPAAPFLTMDYGNLHCRDYFDYFLLQKENNFFYHSKSIIQKFYDLYDKLCYYNKFKISNVDRSCIKFIFNTVFYAAEQSFILFCDLGTENLQAETPAWRQKVR